MVFPGDILLVKTGSSYGKVALVDSLPQPATINPQFVVLKHIKIDRFYLTYLLQSEYARKKYEEFVIGTAIPTFTQEALNNMRIPLPPYAEQVLHWRIIVTIAFAGHALKDSVVFQLLTVNAHLVCPATIRMKCSSELAVACYIYCFIQGCHYTLRRRMV